MNELNEAEAAAAAPAAPSLTREGEVFASRGAPLDYVPQAPPAAGAGVDLRPGLRWLRMPLPMSLNHINLWLIAADGGWVLVDTGMATAATRDLWAERAPELLDGRPLRRIVLTHFHPDHAGLAAWLQDRHGVPVWMSRDTHAVLEQWARQDPQGAAASSRRYYESHGVSDPTELDLMAGGGVRRTEMRPALPVVERFVGDGDRFGWNGSVWRALATDGHATGHLCFEVTSGADPGGPGLLIAGDQVLPTISPNVSLYPEARDPDPVRSYLESLTRLAALPAHLVLPSHGIPFHGLARRAGALSAHHALQLDKLHAACSDGARSAHELLAVMYRRALGPFDKTLGIGETVAHLEHLVAQRRLERRTDGSGRVRYAAAGPRSHALI